MVILLVGWGHRTGLAYPTARRRIPRCDRSQTMLIGAHVSPAGGPANAVARGVERGCDAIQIFNQNPRAWKPTVYSDEQVADFRAAMAVQPRRRAAHPRGLPAQRGHHRQGDARQDARLADRLAARRATRSAPTPSSCTPAARWPARSPPRSSARARSSRRRWPRARRCPLHLENTAGTGGTLGRSFQELADLIDAAGGSPRLGLCLDSCHLFASGYDIRTEEGLTQVLDECADVVGLDRLGSLHLNDSQTPLGSNRDRHADVGEGELGRRGCAVFLSEPRFDGPAVRARDAGPRSPRADEGADHHDASSPRPGSASVAVRARTLRVHMESAALRPRSIVARWCTTGGGAPSRARNQRDPPPPVQR